MYSKLKYCNIPLNSVIQNPSRWNSKMFRSSPDYDWSVKYYSSELQFGTTKNDKLSTESENQTASTQMMINSNGCCACLVVRNKNSDSSVNENSMKPIK